MKTKAEKRFHENRESRFAFGEPSESDPILIVCPKCQRKGVVLPHGENEVRAICPECGYSATKSANSRSYYWYDENPTDGYFGFELWLRVDCNGNSLWAFNLAHLGFLESFISATLRERQKDEEYGWSNSSLASRLPKWIKAAKNREVVLKAVNELKEKA